METYDFKKTSREIRKNTLKCIASLGKGHVGGCMSVVELLSVLYDKHLHYDPKNPKMEGRDRLIMSKGHAGPALYSILSMKGFFDEAELLTLNQPHTHLPSHCDMHLTKGIDMTTGSLGQGFSCAVGVALASRLAGDGATIYTVIGDGEAQEGQIWEAAMFAGNQHLNHLIGFIDYNKCQVDGTVEDIADLSPLDKKWEAFKWNVIVVKDGHDEDEIDRAITQAKQCPNKPTMIILNTTKGKGIHFVENLGPDCHHINFDQDDLRHAVAEIDNLAEVPEEAVAGKQFDNI